MIILNSTDELEEHLLTKGDLSNFRAYLDRPLHLYKDDNFYIDNGVFKVDPGVEYPCLVFHETERATTAQKQLEIEDWRL